MKKKVFYSEKQIQKIDEREEFLIAVMQQQYGPTGTTNLEEVSELSHKNGKGATKLKCSSQTEKKNSQFVLVGTV